MKYTRTLDLIVASVHYQIKGDFEKAAEALSQAASSKDVNRVLAALDNASEKAYAQATASVRKTATLADFLKEVASKKAKAGSKKKPLKKKKAKASDDGDDQSFDEVVDDMTDEEAEAPEDLSLDDMDFGDDTIELDDSVEELPVAEVEVEAPESTEVEGPTDFEGLDTVEASDDEDEDDVGGDTDEGEAGEEETEEAKVKTKASAPVSKSAKMSRVNANLRALSRLDTAA